jgi:hypothetical protein
MAYWRPMRGMGDPIPIRQFNGVFKPDDEGFNLDESYFTELENLCADNYPAMSTRPGYSVLGTYGTRVLGMGAWKGTELHVVFNDGTWRKYVSGVWTTLASGLSTTAEWSFCNFKGNLADINLIGSNGVDAIKRYDGSTVQNLLNAPATGNYIVQHSNRLYCAVGNLIKFCALSKPTDWTTVDDSGTITHETDDGKTINGLKASSGHVTTGKRSSVYELYGKGPSSYTLEPAGTDIGITNNKAMTLHDDRIPFIGQDAIYQYSGGIRPQKDFSTNVQAFIRDMNADQLDKCSAGSDGEHIYFAIPCDAATDNDTIFQYHPVKRTWYLWKDIAPTHFLRIGQDLYIGDISGRVLKVTGSTDNGTAIAWKAVTKPFISNTSSRKMHWFKLWATMDLPSGSTMSMYVSDKSTGDDWTLVKTLSADLELQPQKVTIPTNTIANANVVRVKLEGTGPVTIYEITRQLREKPMR